MHLPGRVYAGVALVASTMTLARAEAPVSRQTPRARPDAVGLSAARLRDATDLLNRYVSEHRMAGAVAAVARRGQLAYLEAVGVQDLETRAPMTERSLFRIYSMTKSVTAVAVMMLHEERRFSLDDATHVALQDGGLAPKKTSLQHRIRTELVRHDLTVPVARVLDHGYRRLRRLFPVA